MQGLKTKVLVVDDEDDICNAVEKFLTMRNYEIFIAHNHDDAIDVVKRVAPHVVLLDIRLGVDSGMDVLTDVKAVDPKIKVIMLSALDDEESIKTARKLGADDYIAKPFGMGILEGMIVRKIAELGKK